MQTITRTIEAYTLAELKTLAGDRERTYEKALEAVKGYANLDGDYVTWITECLNMALSEEKAVADVEMDGWNYDRGYANIKGDVHVANFMAANKLNGKYRALAYAIKRYGEGVFDTYFAFDTDKQRDLDDLFADKWEEDLDRYTDLRDEDRPRYDRLVTQIKAVGIAINNYISDLQSKMSKQMTAEIEYRYSDDFAIAETEALELLFTRHGKIVHV